MLICLEPWRSKSYVFRGLPDPWMFQPDLESSFNWIHEALSWTLHSGNVIY